jgi:hypothetical protein
MKFIILTIPLTLLAINITAQAEPLNVKAGLWETTTTSVKQGARRPTNLDQLTPEQRAKVEQKLDSEAKKETRTVTSCLNDAQIQSGEAFIGRSHQASCTYTFLNQTPGDLVADLHCAGVNAMTGRIEMHAADPEHMSGKVAMTYGAGDKLQLLNRSEVNARWVKADCGTVTARNVRNHH